MSIGNATPVTDNPVESSDSDLGPTPIPDNPGEPPKIDPAPTPSHEKGTYENPYDQRDIANSGLQTIIDEVHNKFKDKADIYFAPGVYYSDRSEADKKGKPIFFYQGMSLTGRGQSDMAPARGKEKTLLIGGIELSGNNTIDSIRLQNIDGSFPSGIIANDANGIVLKNIEIGTLNKEGSYAIGIAMENSNITVENSKIYGYQKGAAIDNNQINAIGIEMIGDSKLTISGSVIDVRAEELNCLYNHSGNAYGIYADGRNQKIIIQPLKEINDKDINGDDEGKGSNDEGKDSKIDAHGKGGKDYSGNGYGIFVGKNHYNFETNDNNVNDNEITISNATVKGQGEVGTADVNIGKFSGNGYGLLVGHGYQHIDKVLTEGNISSSINNNKIKVENSELSGLGSQMFSGEKVSSKETYFSGNGYAMAIGSGVIYIEQNANNSKKTLTLDSKISGNVIEITDGSKLSGEGVNNNLYAYFSGYSYGVLVGNGLFEADPNSKFNANVDLSISNNELTVTNNSTIDSSSSNAAFKYDFARRLEPWIRRSLANNFGILIGYGGWSNNKNLKVTSNIDNNKLTISDGVVNISYGEFEHNVYDARKDGDSYGVLIGSVNKNIVAKKNKLEIKNSRIDFRGAGKDSNLVKKSNYRSNYGIIMHGELDIDDSTKNAITRDDGLTSGKKINTNNINLGWSSGWW